MMFIFVVGFISHVNAQDYWNPVDTITAPASFYLDEYTGTIATNDNYVAVGITSQSGVAGTNGRNKNLVKIYKINGTELDFMATLSCTDLIDSLGNSKSYVKFGHTMSMSENHLVVGANYDSDLPTPTNGRHMRAYIYDLSSDMEGLVLEDKKIEVSLSAIQSNNELPNYAVRIRGNVLAIRQLNALAIYRFDGSNWNADGGFSISQYKDYEIVNDNVIVVESDETTYDGMSNILTWGAVNVYHYNSGSWSKTLELTEPYSQDYTNYGDKLTVQFVSDDLQYLVVESDTKTDFYEVTNNTDWVNGPVSVTHSKDFTDFTFTKELVYAWDASNMYYSVFENAPNSILSGFGLTDAGTDLPKGKLIGNRIFLEKETHEDSVFQSTASGDLNTSPYALYTIDLADAGNPSGGEAWVETSALANFGNFSGSVIMTDQYLYYSVGTIDAIQIFKKNDETWQYQSTIEDIGKYNIKIQDGSDSLIYGYSFNNGEYHALVLSKNSTDWGAGTIISEISGFGTNPISQIRGYGHTLGILSNNEIKLFEKESAWSEAATLTLSSDSTIENFVLGIEALLAVDNGNNVYTFQKNSEWTSKTEDQHDDFSLATDSITNLPIDPLINHPHADLVKLLRHNFPFTSPTYDGVDRTFKRIGTKENFLGYGSNKSAIFNGKINIGTHTSPATWYQHTQAAISYNFAAVSRPYAKTERGYHQGDFLIFKREYNEPPIALGPQTYDLDELDPTVNNTYSFGEAGIEDPENDDLDLFIIHMEDTHLINGSLEAKNGYITLNYQPNTYGRALWVKKGVDRLGKSVVSDTIFLHIKPLPDLPSIYQNNAFGFTVYGDSLKVTVNKNSLDGEEIAFFKIIDLSNGWMTDSHGDIYDQNDLISYNDYKWEGYLHGDTVGLISLVIASALDSSTLSSNDSLSWETIKRELFYSINDTSRLYGDPNPTEVQFTYTGFVRNDGPESLEKEPDFSYIGNPELTSSAGNSYTITSDGGWISRDYKLTFNLPTGNFPKLTILRAPLNISVRDTSMIYGSEVPEFVLEYEGFKNGETQDVLNPPTANTTADAQSSAGTYDITLTGGNANNYDLLLSDGQLTIEKANQEITFQALNSSYRFSASPIQLTASSTSQLPISFISSDTSIATIDNENAIFNQSGLVMITAIQNGNENYLPADSISQEIFIEEILGLGDDFVKGELMIYPNPSSENITLKLYLKKPTHISIRIHGTNGKFSQVIYEGFASELLQQNMDVSKLKAGIYFLQIASKNTSVSEAIMIK